MSDGSNLRNAPSIFRNAPPCLRAERERRPEMRVPNPGGAQLSTAGALDFCASSPAAVVLTVWPSGTNHISEVMQWLDGCGARVVHSQSVPLATPLSELLTVMALYDGEEWLESNCWYAEQPLPDGPPSGPYAGAQWKRALCFKNDSSRAPQAVVVDTGAATSSLWTGKYAIRSSLASLSGNPGNSCIHLTDRQSPAVLEAMRSGTSRTLAGGSACDESYAYACARALLHPASVAWLNSDAAGLASNELGGAAFREAWATYSAWLHEQPGAPVEGEADDLLTSAPRFPFA